MPPKKKGIKPPEPEPHHEEQHEAEPEEQLQPDEEPEPEPQREEPPPEREVEEPQHEPTTLDLLREELVAMHAKVANIERMLQQQHQEEQHHHNTPKKKERVKPEPKIKKLEDFPADLEEVLANGSTARIQVLAQDCGEFFHIGGRTGYTRAQLVETIRLKKASLSPDRVE